MIRKSLLLLIIAPALATGSAWAQPTPMPTPPHAKVELADETVAVNKTEATGQKEVFEANADWLAIDFKPATVAPGSALDFSKFLKAPAGQSGEVVCAGDNFVFKDAPDKAVRFYGNHLTHGLPFVSKEKSDKIADYLAASGFNLIRFHCYTFAKGVMQDTASTEFSPEAQDQLDYMFAGLKKRGIYFTLPLNVGNFFNAGSITDVPEFKDRPYRFEICGLLLISKDAQEWIKKYTMNLLGHVNPYTGMALKDDPALVDIEIDNENGIFKTLGAMPEFVPIFRRKCREFLLAKNGAEPTDQEVEKYLPEYALDLQTQYYEMMRDFLRQAGVTKPLTDISNRVNMAYNVQRNLFDYVDVHSYWDLYKNLPEKDQDGEISYRVRGLNPNSQKNFWILQTTAARIFGKPMACGEFNSDYPSPYWNFVGPALAATAGMQNWSDIIRCGLQPFDGLFFEVSPLKRIAGGGNPLVMLSERIGALIYVGNQVQPLPTKVPIVLTQEYLRSHLDLTGGPLYPPSYTALGFQYQLGTVLLDGKEKLDAYPCLVVPADMKLPESLKDKKVVLANEALAANVAKYAPPAATSPWIWDVKAGTAQIVCPQSETFMLPSTVESGSGPWVKVTGNKTVSVSFAGSLDNEALEKSQHVLAMYLTDIRNTGCEIETGKNGEMLVRRIGQTPLLVRQGKVTMSFRMKDRALLPQIWALKYDGTRSVEITPQKTDEGFSFEAQAVTAPDTFAAYELVWNP